MDIMLPQIRSGWITAGETWTYASADSPSFTFTISGDKRDKYSVGMKIKLTQGSVKYFRTFVQREGQVLLSNKTTYYLNTMSSDGVRDLYNLNGSRALILEAVCAYL